MSNEPFPVRNSELREAMAAVHELHAAGAVHVDVAIGGASVRVTFGERSAPEPKPPPKEPEPSKEEKRAAEEELAYWSAD